MDVVPAPSSPWRPDPDGHTAPSSPWRPDPGGHTAVASITVPLIPAVADALQQQRPYTKLSTTDLTNRAITLYLFFDAHLRKGHDLIVRDNGTGEAHLVRFG